MVVDLEEEEEVVGGAIVEDGGGEIVEVVTRVVAGVEVASRSRTW